MPWTCHQSVAGITENNRQPFALTFIMGYIESPISLTSLISCLQTLGGSLKRTHTNIGRTCQPHTVCFSRVWRGVVSNGLELR